jgi:hypothetical protein
MLVLTEVGVRCVLWVVGADIVDWLGIIEALFVIFPCNETGDTTPIAFGFGEC